jgi:hypothetical protein
MKLKGGASSSALFLCATFSPRNRLSLAIRVSFRTENEREKMRKSIWALVGAAALVATPALAAPKDKDIAAMEARIAKLEAQLQRLEDRPPFPAMGPMQMLGPMIMRMEHDEADGAPDATVIVRDAGNVTVARIERDDNATTTITIDKDGKVSVAGGKLMQENITGKGDVRVIERRMRFEPPAPPPPPAAPDAPKPPKL